MLSPQEKAYAYYLERFYVPGPDVYVIGGIECCPIDVERFPSKYIDRLPDLEQREFNQWWREREGDVCCSE